MKTDVGLWIDHRKAIIVTLSDKEEKLMHILSNVEKQQGRFEGKHSSVSFESQLVQSDGRQQRGFTKHLKVFYDEVISCIGDAESVFIFGPGEAKGELKLLMDESNTCDKMIRVEIADKMTDHQIVTKVHHYFSNSKVKG